MRTKVRGAAAAALTVLTVVTALAVTGCGGGSGGGGDDASSRSPSASPAPRRDCGKTLRVTGHGFSKAGSDKNAKSVSFAATVRNSGDAPVGIQVMVLFLDADGRELPVNGVEGNGAAVPYTLGPVGSGTERAVTGIGVFEKWPAKMKVETIGACLGDARRREARHEVAVEDARVAVRGDKLDARLTLSSPGGEETRGFPVFVFRDDRHRVLGGGPFLGASGTLPTLTAPAGTSKRKVTVDVGGYLPQGADPAATEVSFQPLPSGPRPGSQ